MPQTPAWPANAEHQEGDDYEDRIAVKWDIRYEFRAVLLLFLGFGLVGLDRFMILPMFPTLIKELHLSYPALGYITGALSVAWGVAGFAMGRLSDQIGRRKVVVGAMLAFSILVGVSGLANG